VKYVYYVSYMLLTDGGFSARTAEIFSNVAMSTMEHIEKLTEDIKKFDDTPDATGDPVVLAFCLLRIEEKE
jgi:bacterioferritin (cytochrome b1)